jgi:hypothetical protein
MKKRPGESDIITPLQPRDDGIAPVSGLFWLTQ